MLHRGAPPPEKSIRLRRDACPLLVFTEVASQGLANTADWNDIDQQVGTLADQIVAKIC